MNALNVYVCICTWKVSLCSVCKPWNSTLSFGLHRCDLNIKCQRILFNNKSYSSKIAALHCDTIKHIQNVQKREGQYKSRKKEPEWERQTSCTNEKWDFTDREKKNWNSGCERWCLCWLSFSLILYDFFSFAPMRNGMMCHIKSLVVLADHYANCVGKMKCGKEKEKKTLLLEKKIAN